MISRLVALRKSFQAKIIVALVISMICMAAIFDLILINIQEKTYRSLVQAQSAGLVRMFAHTIRVAVFTESEEELALPVEGLMLQEHIKEVVIWNKEQRRLLQRTRKGAAPSESRITTPAELQLTGQGDDKRARLGRETGDSFIYGGQVSFASASLEGESWYLEENGTSRQGEIVGYVAVRFSKDILQAGVRNILIQTGVSVVLFLGVGIFLIFFIVARVSRPLQELLSTIRKRRADPGRPSDIRVLTETYEGMVTDLEHSFQTIALLNENLEKKVHLRTLQLSQANQELAGKQEKLEQTNRELSQALGELQQTQEQLIQQEKLAAMGQLVAGVAHEVNNTVNFISAALPSLHRLVEDIKRILGCYAELEQAVCSDALAEKRAQLRAVKEELFFDELFPLVDQLLANIDEGARRTSRIVHDLRTFSRSNREASLPLDLHAVIDSTIPFLDRQLMEKVTVDRDYGVLPPVPCLPERMSQVFLNIMNNGIQAMGGEGRLSIRTECRQEKVHLFFRDSGCGIAEQDLQKIFDPFFTTKEIGQGTGLGLGISYTIIRQHGGDIKVESEPGRGTVFEIILPVGPRARGQLKKA
ncbi:sensor histidine kinase [Desulfogranum mediterraneum]|uniref:sensor histidine kinase n=1 Tax=Desulfogranum mediterraneum TaxID=160661 RepID=UPI0003FC0948|nr:ATP-binding protein [Desulfogranum mediterraneum]